MIQHIRRTMSDSGVRHDDLGRGRLKSQKLATHGILTINQFRQNDSSRISSSKNGNSFGNVSSASPISSTVRLIARG